MDENNRELGLRLVYLLSAGPPLLVVVLAALPIDDAARSMWLPLLFVYLIWPPCLFLAFVFALSSKVFDRWFRGAVAVTLFSVIVSRILYGQPHPIRLLLDSSEVVHFITVKPSYDRVISRLPSEQYAEVFIWECDPVGGDGIVYDARDSLRVQSGPRPGDSQRTGGQYFPVLEELNVIEPLWGHYYYVMFS